MTWQSEMAEICDKARTLLSCNVAEIEFDDGTFFEVYFAMTPEQRKKGLACVSELDLPGMLFCYDEPTYVPYSMINTFIDLSVAWYNDKGELIQNGTFAKLSKEPLVCSKAFSFVLETPAGKLPAGNLRLRKD